MIIAFWFVALLLPASANAFTAEQSDGSASISGRVYQDNGSPVHTGKVAAWVLFRGQNYLVHAREPIGLDGSYKFQSLPPGKYVVAVEMEQWENPSVTDTICRLCESTRQDDPCNTATCVCEKPECRPMPYFGVSGGGKGIEQTDPIDLAAGQERSGVDIKIARLESVKIAGRIEPPSGLKVPTDARVEVSGPKGSSFSRHTKAKPDGTFEFCAVPIGEGGQISLWVSAEEPGWIWSSSGPTRIVARQGLQVTLPIVRIQYNGPEKIQRLTPAITVSGIVVDANGQPLKEVQIDHIGQIRGKSQCKTDAQGHFTIHTNVPAFVFRKPGFRSSFFRSQNALDLRVTLIAHEKTINKSAEGPCDSIQEWGASFCFPKVPGVTAGKQVNDIDYGMRYYTVETKSGKKAIRHGSGPLWSFGTPSDDDIWKSVEYSEIVYNGIIDARGKTASGKVWRYLGKFGESASYDDLDPEAIQPLDQVLDGLRIQGH